MHFFRDSHVASKPLLLAAPYWLQSPYFWRILMYAIYTVVLRAVLPRFRAPTFGALTKKTLFLKAPFNKSECNTFLTKMNTTKVDAQALISNKKKGDPFQARPIIKTP